MNGKQLLKEIPDAPVKLYTEGNERLLDTTVVAVVGSRKMTRYSQKCVEAVVKRCVELGYTIVSGCADGVDRYAHEVALSCGGKCIGVLGYGMNIRYPSNSTQLINTLMKDHLVISEYEATTPIRKFQFIARNRIIAAVAQATIVIQAAPQSGSLITAQMALEYNRDVYIVPGEAFSPLYSGGHALIAEGANILYDVNQLE